jgi:hypothetical protein
MSRHSLSDINDLLRDTKGILANMAQDQITLRGSISIAPSETSDTEEPELEEKVADSKAYRRVTHLASRDKDVSTREDIAPNEVLIDFTDKPSLLDTKNEEKVSPAMEELKELNAGFGGLRLQNPDWTPKPLSTAVTTEKRDSAQSTTVQAPSVHVSELDDTSRRTSEIVVTPLSAEPSASGFFRRSPSSASGGSGRSAALDSEFPEVVPEEGLEADIPGLEAIVRVQPSDPFPQIECPLPFLPPTTPQELVILQQRQQEAMQSGDIVKILDWAEDALHFTSIGSMYRARISALQSKRTEASWTERMLEIEAKQVVETYLQQGHPKALFMQAAYFGLDVAKSTDIYLLSLAKGYSRSAFYIGLVYEGNKATISTAVGYYNQGASAGDSACLYVSFSMFSLR